MDDSFNYPLSLLAARLSALAAEAGNFTTVSGRLIDILENETRSLPSPANNIPARGRGRRTSPPLSPGIGATHFSEPARLLKTYSRMAIHGEE